MIVNWVDNVNAMEFYATNFAHSLEGKGCFFTNAFTSSPWTHYTHESIFRSKLAISGKTYMREKLNTENSPFIKTIKEHDYNFYYVANPRVYQSEFSEDMLPEMPRGFDKLIRFNRADSECSTRLQWIALKQRLLSEKPVCIWIHNFCETHWPMWFVGKKNLLHQSMEYLKPALFFLASQLDWYAQFESPNQHSVYLSDHGNGRVTDRGGFTQAFERARSNIAMVIVSSRVEAGFMSRC